MYSCKSIQYYYTITFYSQRCCRHLIGQRVVVLSDVSVVRSCWDLCSESNNTNMLLCPLIAVLGSFIFCFTYQTDLDLKHGGVYLVTMDREFNDGTAPCLYLTVTQFNQNTLTLCVLSDKKQTWVQTGVGFRWTELGLRLELEGLGIGTGLVACGLRHGSFTGKFVFNPIIHVLVTIILTVDRSSNQGET